VLVAAGWNLAFSGDGFVGAFEGFVGGAGDFLQLGEGPGIAGLDEGFFFVEGGEGAEDERGLAARDCEGGEEREIFEGNHYFMRRGQRVDLDT
jgi:hypothetical protein